MLKGHTSNIPLSNIFQTLSLNQQGGLLSVQHGKQERRIGIVGSGITLLTDRPYESKPLRDALARLRILSESEYKNVFSTSTREVCPGDFLLSRHVLSHDQVRGPLREQLLELVYELLSWNDASYQFEVRELTDDALLFRDPEAMRSLVFPINSVLMDVARRDDEWQRIREVLPLPTQIYRTHRHLETLGAVPETEVPAERVATLLGLLETESTVEELFEQSGLTTFALHSALRVLVTQGFVQPLSLEEKKGLSERMRQQFQLPRLMRIYESILEEDPNEFEVRKKLLLLLERRKAPIEELLPHLKHLARSACELNDVVVARGYLERILAVEPNDLTAIEESLRIETRETSSRDVSRLLQTYAGIIRSKRAYERGAEFFASLGTTAHEPGRALVEAAQMYLLSGNAERAVASFVAAAEAFLAAKRFGPLAKVVEKLDSLDPKAAARWRKHIPTGEQGSLRRRRRRLRKAFLLTGLLVSVTGGAYAVYEWDARESYAEALQAARTSAIQGDLDGAYRVLLDCQKQHPLSLAVRKAEGDFAALPRALSGSVVSPSENPTSATLPANGAAVIPDFDAAGFATTGTLLLSRGDYAAALAHYRSVPDERLTPSLSQQVEERCRFLEGYLQAALRLYEEGLAAERDGRLEAASLTYQRLLAEYPNSSAAAEVRLPLLVDVLPEDASVRVGGRSIAGPPYQLRVLPRELPTLTVERTGYVSDSVVLDPTRAPRVRIQLQRDVAWTLALPAPAEARPLVIDTKVFVGTRSGQVLAIDPAKGTQLWSYRLEDIGDVLGDIQAFGQDLVFAGTDRSLYRVRMDDGTLVARIPFPAGAGFCRRPSTPPDALGRVFMVTNEGRVLAADLQAKAFAWNRELGGRGELAPTLGKDRVFVATRDGRVEALDPNDGKPRWRIVAPAPVSAGPTLVGDAVWIADGDRNVRAVDPETGDTRWTRAIPGEVSGFLLGTDRTFCVTRDGRAHALRNPDGQVLWSSDDLGADLTLAGVYGNELITSRGAELVAINPRSGKPRWAHRLEGPLACEPVAHGDRLVLSVLNGTLHLIRLDPREKQ
ncbi:MAG: PQQ-binding-like beta-propeller repeat protein [Planctomycetota bacterium]